MKLQKKYITDPLTKFNLQKYKIKQTRIQINYTIFKIQICILNNIKTNIKRIIY